MKRRGFFGAVSASTWRRTRAISPGSPRPKASRACGRRWDPKGRSSSSVVPPHKNLTGKLDPALDHLLSIRRSRRAAKPRENTRGDRPRSAGSALAPYARAMEIVYAAHTQSGVFMLDAD